MRIGVVVFFLVGTMVFGQTNLTVKMAGVEGRPSYAQDLVTQALKADGYDVKLEIPGDFSGSKLDAMLAAGEISLAILGETPERNAKYLPVKIGMTNNIVGKRVLFIPKGAQKDYDGVKTLADFQKLGKVAGMGKAWFDVSIWNANNLKVQTLDGDWKVLYKMIESKSRGVDYLPRGAHEMINEMADHPTLDVEKNLLLVYQKDQILYVSPKEPRLIPILEKAMKKAQAAGLMKKLVNQYYKVAFEPPLDIDQRTVINLTLP